MEHLSLCNPDMESLRKVAARNIAAALAQRGINEPALIKLGMAGGTAHRVFTGQNLTLDVLDQLATAIKIPAWALLHPDYNASEPLIVRSAAQMEAEVERLVRERIRPLAALIGGLSDTEEPRPDGRSAALPYPDGPATTGKPSGRPTAPTASTSKEKTRKR